MSPAPGRLAGREIVPGVAGGGAAYKAPVLTSPPVQGGAGVTAVLPAAPTAHH